MGYMLIFQPLLPLLLGFRVGPVSWEAPQHNAAVTPGTPIVENSGSTTVLVLGAKTPKLLSLSRDVWHNAPPYR